MTLHKSPQAAKFGAAKLSFSYANMYRATGVLTADRLVRRRTKTPSLSFEFLQLIFTPIARILVLTFFPTAYT